MSKTWLPKKSMSAVCIIHHFKWVNPNDANIIVILHNLTALCMQYLK